MELESEQWCFLALPLRLILLNIFSKNLNMRYRKTLKKFTVD